MRLWLRLRGRLKNERGMALVMAIGITSVLGIAGTTAMVYTNSAAQESQQSSSRQNAFSLAEAGINNAMSVLNLPTNNALDPDTLNKCTTNETKYGTTGSTPTSISSWRHDSYANGTVDWCGTLNRSTAQWYVTAIGNMKNPGRTGYVTRMLQASVSVVPTLTQPLNNPSWNYVYSTHTGSTCDQTLANNVSGGSWMYVAGNLCIQQNVGIGATKLIVGGNLDLENNAYVGANTSMATRAEAYVGGNCRYQKVSSSWHACSGNQDGYNIFSKLSDGATIAVNHSAPVVAPPAADFATWYENAIPGPASSCSTSSGTTPTFDTNYPSRDNSVSTPFDLTPASSYTCRVGPGANTTLSSAMTISQTTVSVPSATGFPTSGTFRIRIDDEAMTVTAGAGTTTWTVTRAANNTSAATHAAGASVYWDNADTSGELSWNATSKTLTVKGTIFIDGSAKVSQTANYNGQATLYLSGTMLFNGSLCGVPTGSSCVFANWNPNSEMLTIVANGTGGQVNAGDSIQFANNQYFQGGLFGTGNVEYTNNASSDGPIMGSQVILANNVVTNSFPNITTVPVGMPGNPAVYAQPNPPQMFSG
jgi:Tfp pilus assembly protein PilX